MKPSTMIRTSWLARAEDRNPASSYSPAATCSEESLGSFSAEDFRVMAVTLNDFLARRDARMIDPRLPVP